MSCASGCEQRKIFENQHFIGQHSAKTAAFATLCRLGLGLGLGLDDPRVTLGSPKRHPRATQGSPQASIGESLLFATRVEKWGWGGRSWLKDAGRGPQKLPRLPRLPKLVIAKIENQVLSATSRRIRVFRVLIRVIRVHPW